MMYYATCSALYQPRAFAQGENHLSPTLTANTLTDTVRQRLHTAASKTADILHQINRLDLAKFLPAAGLTAIRPAAIVHLVNITSRNHVTRDKSIWSFRQCFLLLGQLKDMYPAADYEVACLHYAIQLQYERNGHSFDRTLHIRLGMDKTQSLDRLLQESSSPRGKPQLLPEGFVVSSDSPNADSEASSTERESLDRAENTSQETPDVRQEDSRNQTQDFLFEEWLNQYDYEKRH